MAEHGNDRQHISRRMALTGTALALGATTAAMVRQAAAQQKVSQALANYQGHVEGGRSLRGLHQLPTAERLQIRSRRDQPERLVPTVFP
jgi:hypothetical protein